jgi:glutamate-ammonia-ligase adenylyltransferase
MRRITMLYTPLPMKHPAHEFTVCLPFLPALAGAAPDRAAKTDELAQLSLAQINLADYLAKEASRSARRPAAALMRAMRRLRNLLVCTLIRRDLEGQANLAEVVDAMTRFADLPFSNTWPNCMGTGGRTRHADRPRFRPATANDGAGDGQARRRRAQCLVRHDLFVYPEDGDTAAGPGQRSLSNHEFLCAWARS